MKRLFAAIKIQHDENFMRIYYGLKNQCKYDKINWVKPENIHITLKFFGETTEDKIEPVISELNEIANRHKPFDISLANVGIFGSHYKPRVIWFGIEDNESLKNLGIEILNKMNDVGFNQDRQNFVPHLTIGRIKHIDNKDRFSSIIAKYGQLEIQKNSINSFYLFESKLSSSGPEYHIIKNFNLE